MGFELITILLLGVLVTLLVTAFVVISGMRTRGAVERALNMALFLVRLPRETAQADQKKSEKELISIFEQLMSGFSNIHDKGWNKFIYGEPYLSFELAVHHIGEEIHFYIAVPRSSEEIIEKQIHGLFSVADIEQVKDYNIFNPEGADAGAYVIYEKNKINWRIIVRRYQKIDSIRGWRPQFVPGLNGRLSWNNLRTLALPV